MGGEGIRFLISNFKGGGRRIGVVFAMTFFFFEGKRKGEKKNYSIVLILGGERMGRKKSLTHFSFLSVRRGIEKRGEKRKEGTHAFVDWGEKKKRLFFSY